MYDFTLKKIEDVVVGDRQAPLASHALYSPHSQVQHSSPPLILRSLVRSARRSPSLVIFASPPTTPSPPLSSAKTRGARHLQ